MTLHTLNSQNTVLNKFIAQIRDKSIQTDSMRFRRNLERIGEITAYEISKELSYTPRVVETPLGEATVETIDDRIVVATILRAGLPYHQGFLNYFDDAENAFVSAYRKSTKDGKFTVKVEYISCGDLEDKVLLLVDPMLATGSSLVLAYNALCEKGGLHVRTSFRASAMPAIWPTARRFRECPAYALRAGCFWTGDSQTECLSALNDFSAG